MYGDLPGRRAVPCALLSVVGPARVAMAMASIRYPWFNRIRYIVGLHVHDLRREADSRWLEGESYRSARPTAIPATHIEHSR